MAEPLLALEDVRAGYGDAVVLDGISFDVAEQGSLAVLGRNGVGKTHAAADHHGLYPARPRQHRAGAAATSRAWRRTGVRATGSAGWRRSARFFPRSASRRTSRSRRGPAAGRCAAVYELFPRLNERRDERRQSSFRRRAADAGDRARTNDQSGAAAARRAARRARADHRRGADRRDPADDADEGTAFILVEQHAEVALSLTEEAIVLERGSIVHRARSQDLLQDHATLDRLVGLRLADQAVSSR